MTSTSKTDRLAAAKAAGEASAARRAEFASKLADFRQNLAARLGTPDAVQIALIDCAVSLYVQVLKASRFNRGVIRRANGLAISACVTSLRSTLRLLGAVDATEDGLGAPSAGFDATGSPRRFADLIDDDEKIVVTDNKL